MLALTRVDTHPIFTGATGIAIAIGAAFGTNVGRLAEAAEQSITAVVLPRTFSTGRCHFAAGLPLVPAAIGYRHAHTRIADLALTAITVVTAFGAISLIARGTAEEVVTAGRHLGIVGIAGTGCADAAIHLIDADAGIAHATASAILVDAAFGAVAGLAGYAALPAAAFELGPSAGLAVRNAEMRALPLWNADITTAFVIRAAEQALAAVPARDLAAGADGKADVVAAFLLVSALIETGALGTEAAIAIVVGAALALRQAGIGKGAAVFVFVAIADARALNT